MQPQEKANRREEQGGKRRVEEARARPARDQHLFGLRPVDPIEIVEPAPIIQSTVTEYLRLAQPSMPPSLPQIRSMNEAGPYKWIYIVVTIGYLVFLCILSAMRKIVDFAQREEWNQPRLRQKRKR